MFPLPQKRSLSKKSSDGLNCHPEFARRQNEGSKIFRYNYVSNQLFHHDFRFFAPIAIGTQNDMFWTNSPLSQRGVREDFIYVICDLRCFIECKFKYYSSDF